MSAIEFDGVGKWYGHAGSPVHAIADFSLRIEPGEFVVIVGPSGCGKSTLLRMVAGLEGISRGHISIAGRVVNQVEPAQRDVAMVFQNYALYPHMSVFDNMAYGLRRHAVVESEIARRVQEVARILELQALLQRRPAQLSGGQRQRVAMGRAIVRQPKVFLFDEPLSNLDAKLRAQTRLEIQRLHAELGITSLFVTHDQVEAMTLAQRLIVMNAGVIEQCGAPAQVYAEPASVFVAQFMGSPPMNLLRHAPGVPPGRVLGVRPEHLSLSDTGWPVRLQAVEMLGAERLLHGRLGDEPLVLRIRGDAPFPPVGSSVWVQPNPHQLHSFDTQTGRRI